MDVKWSGGMIVSEKMTYNIYMIPIIVLTSDKRNWLLRGFQHQWEKYGCGLPVTIAGFTPPDFALLPEFRFHSIGDFSKYPVNRWSNALFDLFAQLPMGKAIILLEDYWLIKPINVMALEGIEHFMDRHPECMRFCACTDRLNCGNIRDFDAGILGLDVFEAFESPYQISFQASAWQTMKLLDIMRMGETPWESELAGSNRWQDQYKDHKIFGSRQWPIVYQIMVRNGEFYENGNWMNPQRSLSSEDMQEIKALGFDRP